MPWAILNDLASTEEDEWTTVLAQDTLNAQAKGWTVKPAVLSPRAQTQDTFLGWNNFMAEEFAVIPELVTAKPEEVQADGDAWTMVAEPS